MLPPEIARAAELTPYAVEMRYPHGETPLTPDEATEALSIAEAVLHWAEAEVHR